MSETKFKSLLDALGSVFDEAIDNDATDYGKLGHLAAMGDIIGCIDWLLKEAQMSGKTFAEDCDDWGRAFGDDVYLLDQPNDANPHRNVIEAAHRFLQRDRKP